MICFSGNVNDGKQWDNSSFVNNGSEVINETYEYVLHFPSHFLCIGLMWGLTAGSFCLVLQCVSFLDFLTHELLSPVVTDKLATNC